MSNSHGFYTTFEGEATTVTDSLTTVLELSNYRGYPGLLHLEVENSGDSTLSQFRIELRDHPDGEWYTFLADGDFLATDIRNLLFSDGNLPTLAPSDKGHCHVLTNAAQAVRVRAACTSGNSTTIRVRGARLAAI